MNNGYVTITIDEYRRLLRESIINDIIDENVKSDLNKSKLNPVNDKLEFNLDNTANYIKYMYRDEIETKEKYEINNIKNMLKGNK